MVKSIDTSKIDPLMPTIKTQQCASCQEYKMLGDFKTHRQNHKHCGSCRSAIRKNNLKKKKSSNNTPKPETKRDMKVFLELLDTETLPITLDLISRVTTLEEVEIKKVISFLEAAGVVKRKTHLINGHKIQVWNKAPGYKIFKKITS